MRPDYCARLIAAREQLGLSRREMAARLLTPRSTYEQWEKGQRRTPGVAVVAAEFLSKRALNSERNREIADAIGRGETLAAVASRHDVTKQRIAQIAKSLSVTSVRSGRARRLAIRPRDPRPRP